MIELIAVVYNVVRGIVTQIANAVTGINSNTNTARDNINATTNAARDNVKSHVTSSLAAISSSSIKNVYTVFPTARTVAGNGGTGGIAYADIPISAVNTAKAFILGVRTVYGASTVSYLSYRFISSTVIRAEASYGSGLGGGVDIVWGFTVVEFN